jgi:hypothetical protein
VNQKIKIVLNFVLIVSIPVIFWKNIKVNKIEKPVMETKKTVAFYTGRIGRKYSIKIKLIKRLNKFNGLLTNSFNKRNKITGIIYENEILNLNEFEKGERTGSFLGKFITKSEIIGLWSTPDGKISSPFYLIKESVSDNYIKLPVKKYFNKNNK